MGRFLVLKLGGSLITDKSRPYQMRLDVMKAVSAEIRACLDEGLIDRLVLVHGVGSYGHPPVIKYKLHKGFLGPEQLISISWTQAKVNELRLELAKCLHDAGVPVNLFHVSSVATAEDGVITHMHLDGIRGFEKVGMVPLMGGDMVADKTMGFSVGSGDRVGAILARELGADLLVFATDVEGVFDCDPKSNPDAELISDINLGNLAAADALQGKDASGAMRGKLASMECLRKEMLAGMNISVLSMLEPGNLRRLLKGEPVGTSIRL